MDEFFKMDIFFAVTTAAVIVLTAVAVPVLLQLRRVFKHLEHISAQVSAESDAVREDVALVRNEIRSGGRRMKSLFGLFTKTIKRTKGKR